MFNYVYFMDFSLLYTFLWHYPVWKNIPHDAYYKYASLEGKVLPYKRKHRFNLR